MSRIATDWAWELALKPASVKLLLLSMADRADEYHCCFPSLSRLARDTGLDQKTVNRNIQKLLSLELIEDTGERKGVTGRVKVYRILGITDKRNRPKNGPISQINEAKGVDLRGTEDSAQKGNIAKSGGVANASKNGGMNAPKYGEMNHPKNGSQNQSMESPKEPIKNNSNKSLDYSCWPELPSAQTLEDWLAMRKRKKANVTQTVLNRLAPQLQLAVANGVSVDDCLAECVLRNWQGFEFAWMQNVNTYLNRGQAQRSPMAMGKPLCDDFNQHVDGWEQ